MEAQREQLLNEMESRETSLIAKVYIYFPLYMNTGVHTIAIVVPSLLDCFVCNLSHKYSHCELCPSLLNNGHADVHYIGDLF